MLTAASSGSQEKIGLAYNLANRPLTFGWFRENTIKEQTLERLIELAVSKIAVVQNQNQPLVFREKYASSYSRKSGDFEG